MRRWRADDGLARDAHGDGRALAEVVVEFVRPVQERTRAYLDDPGHLDEILREATPIRAILLTHHHPDHAPGAVHSLVTA